MITILSVFISVNGYVFPFTDRFTSTQDIEVYNHFMVVLVF